MISSLLFTWLQDRTAHPRFQKQYILMPSTIFFDACFVNVLQVRNNMSPLSTDVRSLNNVCFKLTIASANNHCRWGIINCTNIFHRRSLYTFYQVMLISEVTLESQHLTFSIDAVFTLSIRSCSFLNWLWSPFKYFEVALRVAGKSSETFRDFVWKYFVPPRNSKWPHQLLRIKR